MVSKMFPMEINVIILKQYTFIVMCKKDDVNITFKTGNKNKLKL